MSDPAIQTAIWMALKGRVQQFALPTGFSWVFPAGTTTPTGNRAEVMNITAAPSRVFVGSGSHERTGTLQITLKHLLPVVTYEATQQLAGQIADHFPTDLRMRFRQACVAVASAPQIHEGFEDGGYWTTPIRIRWRSAG